MYAYLRISARICGYLRLTGKPAKPDLTWQGSEPGINLVLGTGEAGLNGKMLQVAHCRL